MIWLVERVQIKCVKKNRRKGKNKVVKRLNNNIVVLALITILSLSVCLHFLVTPVRAGSSHTIKTIEHIGLPRLNEISYKVILDPEWQVDVLLAGEVDMMGHLYFKYLLEQVAKARYNLTWNFFDNIDFFVINCRDYFPPEALSLAGQPAQPLNDTSFRKAMAYVFGMDRKNQTIMEIHGNLSCGVQSIVPPGQREWYNPKVTLPETDFNLAWQILRDAGYHVSDGKLHNPDGTPVRDLEIWYSGCVPTKTMTCSFADCMNEFFTYINATGNPRCHAVGKTFSAFIYSLMVYHDFDMCYLGLGNFGRFTDWLYNAFHSSSIGEWKWNFAGIGDPHFDELLNIIKYFLNRTEVKKACYEFQEYFNEELPWLPISSDYLTAAYNPELVDFVPTDCYGSDNDWTWMLMHWKGQPKNGTVKRSLLNPPYEINPFFCSSLYYCYNFDSRARILDRIVSKLIMYDPYTHENRPWIAYDWDFEAGSWPELGIDYGECVTFYLRNDVYWQDSGAINPRTAEALIYPVTSEDCRYSIETWVKNWSRYEYHSSLSDPWWNQLVYTETDGPYVFRCYFNNTSIHYLNDIADKALLSPKHVWSIVEEMIQNGTIKDRKKFQPYKMTYKELTGNNPPAEYPYMKALVGCGPYVFHHYDEWPIETGSVKKYEEFFVNSPIECAVGGYPRADPRQAFNYTVHLMNVGSIDNVTSQFVSTTVDVKTYVDDILANTVTNLTIHPFKNVTFGPYSTKPLLTGAHRIRVEVLQNGELIDTYEVTASIPQDINLDFKVDIKDIVTAAAAFGSYLGHPRWDARADIDNNFVVDIKDIVLIARHFGWPYD